MNKREFMRYYPASIGLKTPFKNLGFELEECSCKKKNCKGFTLKTVR